MHSTIEDQRRAASARSDCEITIRKKVTGNKTQIQDKDRAIQKKTSNKTYVFEWSVKRDDDQNPNALTFRWGKFALQNFV